MNQWLGLLKTTGVAAAVDVQGDVPVQAEQRRDERDDRQAARQCSPRRLAGDLLGEALEPPERRDQLASMAEAAHQHERQREGAKTPR